MGLLSSQPYKGTRDYYPSDKRIQNYIFETWKRVSELYGFEEYCAPMLEPFEIYAAKSGQEIVNDQTYTFADRGGRIVAIRPEMTPSICRIVAARRQEMAFPAKLYSIANFMRYERPQRGREREFWQLNIDIFDADGVKPEAEIISMANHLMIEFGAMPDDYVIRINNRKLINFMMAQYLGLDSVQAQLMIKLFDRRDKISEHDFIDQATEIIDDETNNGIEKVKDLLNAKSMADLPVEIRESAAVREVQELFTLLDRADVSNIIFDITLMRGFDYYTGMVFEVFDAHPDNNRALFGGGRYDGLIGMFGVEQLSAVGFAPGLTMMECFLEAHGLIPKLISRTDLYVIPLGEVFKEADKLTRDLRSNGINVEIDLTDRKIDKQIKTAVKKEISKVLFIGESEIESGIYPIKDLENNREYNLDFAGIVSLIRHKAKEK